MSAISLGRPSADSGLVLGGMPRVLLLPREVRDGQKSRALRRRLLAALVIVVVLAVLATVGATLALVNANAELANEQSRSALLAASRAKYGDVTQLQSQVDEIASSQPLAASGEILWAPYLAAISATLPAGTTITAFTAQLASAEASGTPATAADPLAPTHLADIKLTADSPQQPISDWLDNLTKVPGFVAANPGTVTRVIETGHYTTEVDLLVNTGALSNRYPTTGAKK